MPQYEHVFIARQDISAAQAETLIEEFSKVLGEGGGAIVGVEYWGLRALAYKINKNRKGHYAFLRVDAPAPAIAELERRERIHEDVLRYMTVKVEKHDDGPSAVVTAKSSRDDRRGGRGDRDGPRGDRDRGERGGGRGFDRDGPRGDRDGPRGERPAGDRPMGDRPMGDRPMGDRGPRRDGFETRGE